MLLQTLKHKLISAQQVCIVCRGGRKFSGHQVSLVLIPVHATKLCDMGFKHFDRQYSFLWLSTVLVSSCFKAENLSKSKLFHYTVYLTALPTSYQLLQSLICHVWYLMPEAGKVNYMHSTSIFLCLGFKTLHRARAVEMLCLPLQKSWEAGGGCFVRQKFMRSSRGNQAGGV